MVAFAPAAFLPYRSLSSAFATPLIFITVPLFTTFDIIIVGLKFYAFIYHLNDFYIFRLIIIFFGAIIIDAQILGEIL